MIRKGKIALIAGTPKSYRNKYPAANWLKSGEYAIVKLLEDAPHNNTLDVIDVDVILGSIQKSASIYDFNIIGVLSKFHF